MSTSAEAMNVAIAEAIGRMYYRPTDEEVKSGSYYQYEPNFTGSLDAMATAEATLDDCPTYAAALKMVMLEAGLGMGSGAKHYLWHASAEHRAVAFCRLRKIGPFREPSPFSAPFNDNPKGATLD